jgi:uncharacterized protein (TIGR02757 family)
MDGIKKLRAELNALYAKYHKPELLNEDPLGLVSGKLSDEDFELVSYVSASISYGRTEQIRKSLQKLWKTLHPLGIESDGANLHAYIVENSGKTLKKDFSKALKGWVHRFNNEEDILVLFQVLQLAIKDHKSLGAIYTAVPADTPPTERLQRFVASLRKYVRGKDLEHFKWFSCSPEEGSTCKRMVMWLRWMLRHDELDPGTWTKKFSAQGVGPHLAFIPMDTHVHKWALRRGLLSTKSPSWKSVEELSAILRLVDAADPARFDFCICHEGMARFREGFKSQRTL